jgi:uncharacterized membrane protein (UPF0127 family)
MFSRISLLAVTGLAGLLLLTSGCDRDHDDKPAVAASKTIEDHFPIRLGTHTVQMQVAALPGEMERGLMFRKSLSPDEGMIFVYSAPVRMSFWMRNTDVPLDIGYFDPTGELKEIYPMYAHDEHPVGSRAKNLQFALEMNLGWYASNNVHPGEKLDLKALAEALRARGLKPGDFGMP